MLTLAPDCKLFLHPIAKNHNIGKCVKCFALLKQRDSHDSRKNDEQINAAKPVLAFTSENERCDSGRRPSNGTATVLSGDKCPATRLGRAGRLSIFLGCLAFFVGSARFRLM